MQHLHSLAPLIQASSVSSVIILSAWYILSTQNQSNCPLHPILHQYLGLIPFSVSSPHHFPRHWHTITPVSPVSVLVSNHIHLRICQRQSPTLYFPLKATMTMRLRQILPWWLAMTVEEEEEADKPVPEHPGPPRSADEPVVHPPAPAALPLTLPLPPQWPCLSEDSVWLVYH